MNTSTRRRRGREAGGRKQTKQSNDAHSEVENDDVPAVNDTIDTVATLAKSDAIVATIATSLKNKVSDGSSGSPQKRKCVWRTVFGVWRWSGGKCERTKFAFRRNQLFFFKKKSNGPEEPVAPANWFCEKCLKKFVYKKNWQKHICAQPMDREELTCPMCEKVFTQKNNLNRHVKTVHEKVRYSCKSCEKSYSRQDNAHSHMKVCRMNLFG